MDSLPWLEQTVTVLKTVAPWVTGGLAGAILTLLMRSRATRRQRKRLTVDITRREYTLPKPMPDSSIAPEDLSVSYLGKSYRSLLLYKASIRNTGSGMIDTPELVFLLPADTTVVREPEVSSSPLELAYEHSKKVTKQGIEHSIKWERLENTDDVVVTFLMDCDDPEAVRCIPRGLEDVDCRIGEAASESEAEGRIRHLLGCAALFVLLGSIPLFGGPFQAAVIVSAIPSIMYLVNAARGRRRLPLQQIVRLGDVTVDPSGSLEIGQFGARA